MKFREKIILKHVNGSWKVSRKENVWMKFLREEYKDELARSECLALFHTLLYTIADNVETKEDVEANLDALMKKADGIITTMTSQLDEGSKYHVRKM